MTQPSTPFDPRTTEEYREFGYKIVNCPVCGKETLDDYFICPTCGWEYDPEVGYPEGGIEPGTAFEDLPEDFECPLCGVGKSDFSEA